MILLLLVIMMMINNNNDNINNNDNVNKNQMIWLNKCFLRLCLKVFCLWDLIPKRRTNEW